MSILLHIQRILVTFATKGGVDDLTINNLILQELQVP